MRLDETNSGGYVKKFTVKFCDRKGLITHAHLPLVTASMPPISNVANSCLSSMHSKNKQNMQSTNKQKKPCKQWEKRGRDKIFVTLQIHAVLCAKNQGSCKDETKIGLHS